MDLVVAITAVLGSLSALGLLIIAYKSYRAKTEPRGLQTETGEYITRMRRVGSEEEAGSDPDTLYWWPEQDDPPKEPG